MTYQILRLLHIIGAILIGAGLIGVWLSDLRSRQVRDLPRFGEAVRNVRVFYDGLVFPGALLLLASGTWLIVTVYGGSGAITSSRFPGWPEWSSCSSSSSSKATRSRVATS